MRAIRDIAHSVTACSNRALAAHPAVVDLALQLHLGQDIRAVVHDRVIVRGHEHAVHS